MPSERYAGGIGLVQQTLMRNVYDRVDLQLCHAIPVMRIGPEVVRDLQRTGHALNDIKLSLTLGLLYLYTLRKSNDMRFSTDTSCGIF